MRENLNVVKRAEQLQFCNLLVTKIALRASCRRQLSPSLLWSQQPRGFRSRKVGLTSRRVACPTISMLALIYLLVK